MGVDSVESSSRQKATKNKTDKGVAGRNMMASDTGVYSEQAGSPETGARRLGIVLSEGCEERPRGRRTARGRSGRIRGRGGRIVKRVTGYYLGNACCGIGDGRPCAQSATEDCTRREDTAGALLRGSVAVERVVVVSRSSVEKQARQNDRGPIAGAGGATRTLRRCRLEDAGPEIEFAAWERYQNLSKASCGPSASVPECRKRLHAHSRTALHCIASAAAIRRLLSTL